MSNGVNPLNGNTPAQQAAAQISANHFEGLEARTMMAGDPMAGNDSALAYDNAGNLHVAYYDANSKSLKYTMQSVSSGTWSAPVTVDASSKDVGKQLTIAIGKNNKPGIAYRDVAKQDLKYASFDGKKWTVTTVDAKKNTGVNPSLAYNKQGDALISFFRPSSNDLVLATGGLKGWTFTTIATGSAAGKNSAVAVDPKTGLPAVAFEGNDGKVRYVEKTKQGGMATPVVVETTSKGGGEVSLTFGPDKKPAFSYYDPQTGEIKLATKSGKGFNVATVATVEPGQDPNAKVMIDPATGKPQVAFYDSANDGVFVANKNGEVTKVADGGSAGTPVVINPKTGKVVFTEISEDGTPAVQDTTVIPAAPSDVAVETVSDSELLVSWSDNSDNEAGFLIERSLDDENWETVTTVAANVTSYSDTELTEGTAYVYRVTAVGPTGAKSVAAELGDGATLPAAPSNVEASTNSPNTVSVSWSDNSDGEEGYVLQRSSDGGVTFTFLAERPAGANHYTDNSVVEGTSYVYRVFATGAVGSSDAATSDAVTTGLLAPSGLAAVSVSATHVNLAWTNNSNKSTGATIERSADGGETWTQVGTVSGSASVFVDSTADAGALYVYRVKATKNGNNSAHANSSQTRVRPSAPAVSTTVVATTQVNLAWEPVNSAVSYVIERSSDAGETFTQIGTTTQTAYSDDSVTEGSAYVYRIRAINAGGASANSNSANATTFLAAPSDLEVSPVSTTQVDLSWTDNSSGETSFRIERSSDGGDTWDLIASANPNSTSYQDTTVLEGRSYLYRVQGYKTIVQSDYTSEETAITPMVAPTNLSVTAISINRIDLSWDDNSDAETGYEIYRLGGGSDGYVLIATTIAGANSISDLSVVEGTTYSYKIRAVNAVTQSDMTDAESATTKPAAPSGLAGTVVSPTRIDLAWADNSNGETAYTVEFSTDGGSTWGTLASLDAGSTSYSHTTGSEGTSYSYRVIASNSAGNSAASSTVTAVTLVVAASDLAATSTSATEVQLTWTDNSDAELGYIVERSSDGGDTFTVVSTLLAAGTELFNDDSAAAGTIYVYRILAVNSASASAASATDTVLTLPAAATGVAAVGTSATTVSLAWNAVTGASGYLVERTADGGANWVTLGTPSMNSFEDTTATEGGTFAYRVTSQNATGSGDVSAESTPVTTVPATPTDLVATPVSAGQVDITWTDTSDHETGFVVQRSSDNGATWTTLHTTASDVETWSDVTVSGGTSYVYRVRATGDAGNSADSGTDAALTNPAAVSDVDASTVSISATHITWSDVTGETGYLVERSVDSGTTWTTVATLPAGSTSADDTGLTEGTAYLYRVTASNATGDSAAGNTDTGTTIVAAPTTLANTPVSATRVDLTWADNSAHETAYRVERSDDGGTTWSTLATLGADAVSYSDTTTTAAATFKYRVIAVGDAGDSAASNVSSVLTVPAAPSSASATASADTRANVSWTPVTGATGYTVQRSTDGGTTFTTLALVGNVLTYADTSANEATAYVYRVLADNTTGSSAPSPTSAVTTLPAAATNLTKTLVSPTQVDLAWTDNSGGETGYLVERSSDGGVNFTPLIVRPAGSTSYSDTAATEGTAYVYRIKPVNITGTGAGVTVSAATAPVAPTALGLTPVSATRIDLAWTDNSTHETGYAIERSTDGTNWTLVHTAATNANSWSDTTVSGGTTYHYRVRAVGVGTDSADSNAPSQLTIPAAVSDLALSVVSDTQINVTWTDTTGETGYTLERSDDDGSTWSTVNSPAANATSFNDTTVVEGVTYTYRLTSANGTGSSAASNTPSATTLPAAADTLTATPVNSGQVDLAWDDNSANETAFVIERSTDAGATWTTVHTTANNIESWSDTNVSGGTTYTYRVTAKQGAALSAASNTDAALTHPAAVANFYADVVSATQVDLTWDAVTGAATYLVEVSDDGGSTWSTLAAANATTSYSHSTADEATEYTYRVTATNATGDGASVTDTATTLAAAVTNVSATADSTTQITLTWDDNSSGETGYRIEHSSDGGTTWTTLHTTAAGVTTWAHTGLTAGTTHAYRVIAENATGDSAVSNTDSAITYPAVPANLSATVLSDTEVDLAWDAVSSATGYHIEVSTDAGSTWGTLTTVGAVTTHSVTNATEATSYVYRVSAINGAGTGAASATEAAVTLAAAPANVNATVNGATEIVVSWDDTSAGESGFRIERSDDGGTTWNEVHTTANNATFWTDNTVSAATSYKYRVIAENATGDSAVSNVATGFTYPDQQTGVEAEVISTTRIDLTWDAMPTATIYTIDYSSDGGSTWQTLVVLGNVQTYSHTTANEGTTYHYQVFATNTSGSGLGSTPVIAKTYSAAATSVDATPVNAGRVDIAWDDNSSGESGYKIQRSEDDGVTWHLVHTAAADAETWSDTTVDSGAIYKYRVVATNATGDSAVSNVDTVLTHPNQVQDLTATPTTDTSVTLAWSPAPTATSYLVEVSDDGGSTWSTLTTTAGVVYGHTGADEATQYTYRVSAINATGTGVASSEESAYTYAALPDSLVVTPTTATNIDLTWDDNSSGETGYVIERSHDGGTSWYVVHTNAASDNTWSDTTVTGASSFQYRVFAQNQAGDTPSITAAAVLTVPASVANFTPTAVSTTAINWTWDAATGTVTGYRIEVSNDAGSTWSTVTTINDPTTTLFADTGLTEGTDYLYRIVAFNATGDSADASDTGSTFSTGASNLVATPQSTTSIDLAWDDNSTGEDGFKIQRSTDNGTTWTTIHTTAANVESWTDATASAGTSYVYQILAYNEAGNAAASNTDDVLTIPAAATNIIAAPVSATTVSVSWDAVTGATSYTLRRSTDGGNTWTNVGSTSTLTLDDTGRTEATLYTYDVVASNATGDAADSANQTATTLPAAATTLAAVADGTTGMDLTWSDNSAAEDGYKIYRSDDNGTTWNLVHTAADDVTSWSDSGLTEGTSYQYRVYAYNASGNAAVSNTATANTAPEAVTGVSATADSATQVTVTWTDHSAGEDGFIIEASTDGGSTWTEVGDTAANVTTYAHTTATEGDTTEYRVRAYKGAVESADAATDSVTTVPAAASNMTATPVDHNTVDLAWDDNSASETDYDIYRSTDGGTSWTKIHTAAANAESWADAAAPENVALKYKVVAVGSAGDSADSSAASATTPIATPTTLSATTASNTTVNLTWADNSSVETGYKVYRSADAGATWTLLHTTAADATSYSDTTGVENTTYTYKVVATDGSVNSADSNTDADKTKLDAPAITGVSSPTATSVSLTWSDNSDAETGYEIDRSDDGGTNWTTVHTTAADVTTWTNTGLTEATQYKFRVRAVNASNDSAYSAVSTLTTIPASASNVAASPFSTTQIDITWDDNSANETGYVIERSTDGGTSWTDIHTAAADAEAWSDTGLTEGTDYQYRVRATGAGGNGIVSAADDTSTMPSAPTGLTSTGVNATRVDLAWTDNSAGETDYVIERSTDNGVSFSALTTVAAGSTSYSDTAAPEGTGVVYRVKAVRGAVSSAWSNSSVQVITLPAGATDLAVTTPTNTRAVLTWTDNSSGETGYKVYRSADAGANWTLINTTAASATTYSDNTITEGGTYSYRVVAFNVTGDGVASAVVTVTSVPASPTGLSGSAANPSRIDLSWTDRSNAETGYKVERSTNGGSTWSELELLPANSTSYSDTTVTEGANYQYRVRAYNTAGNSGFTNSVSVTTPLLAPTSLTATTVTATRIDLAWVDNSTKESQYKVERSADGGTNWTVIATTGANVTSYSDTSAAEGTAYTYRVRASRTGNTSLYTSNVGATTLPAAPTGINASVASANQVNLSWSDNSAGEANFVVERSTDNGTTWTQIATPAANATSYNDSTATEGTAYTYRVKAVNTGGSTAWSTSAQVTTLPAAPTDLVATSPYADTVELTWTDNSAHETGYKIERSDDNGISWTQIGTAAAGATSYADFTVEEGTAYQYRVRANISASNSAYSNTETVTTVPLDPSDLVATTVSATQIDLAWDDNSAGETGFKIERSDDGGITWNVIHTAAADATSYSDMTVTEGLPFQYRVRAINAGGNSGYTSTAEAFALPAAPTGLSATAVAPDEIDLTWTDTSVGEEGFYLEREDSDDPGNWILIDTLSPDSNSYADMTVTAGKTYSYRLRAFNTAGDSANSATDSATVPNP